MTRMTLFFFHLVWRRSVFFFSFYKLTSYPFFTNSSPVPNGRLFIYLFILFHPSTPIYLCIFIFFLSLSSSYILCYCLHVLCLILIVHYVCVRVLTIYVLSLSAFFFLYSVCFLFMGAVKIGLKRMIKHFPSFSSACVYF